MKKTKTETYLLLMKVAVRVAEGADIAGNWLSFKAMRVAMWAEDKVFPLRYVTTDEATPTMPSMLTIMGDTSIFRECHITVTRGDETVIPTINYHDYWVEVIGLLPDDKVHVMVGTGYPIGYRASRHFVFDPDEAIVNLDAGYTPIEERPCHRAGDVTWLFPPDTEAGSS